MIKMPETVASIVRTIQEAGYEAYVVGGCVRDALLMKEPHDWDITTSALPEEIMRIFKEYPTLTNGIKHGTVFVIIDREMYDITTYRTESTYSDGRHPDAVSFTTSLTDDLKRRDFTINAMAYAPQAGIVDLYGGQEDLRQGIVRCVGDAYERFNEDALRMLRALRFASKYGFRIADETSAVLKDPDMIRKLEHVSVERIYSELSQLLLGRGAVALLREYHALIAYFLPVIGDMVGCSQHNKYHMYDVYEHSLQALGHMMTIDGEVDETDRLILRIAALLHDCGKPSVKSIDEAGWEHFYQHAAKGADLAGEALSHLKAPRQVIDTVCDLILLHDCVIQPSRRTARRLMAKMDAKTFDLLMMLKEADIMAHSPKGQAHKEELAVFKVIADELRQEDAALTVRDLMINGHDIMALGVPEGEEVGRILQRVLDEVFSERLPNERDPLLSYVKRECL